LKKILFFSSNINKVKEIKNIFKKNKLNILSLNDFANLKNPLENGKTFVENAKIKSFIWF
jgi:Xanthosine triphosphate pyrophosphatase